MFVIGFFVAIACTHLHMTFPQQVPKKFKRKEKKGFVTLFLAFQKI
jgi:hypothetical protein